MIPHPALVDQIRETYLRVQSHLIRTPLIRDVEHHLFLKNETAQRTGSFKWRGALAKLSSLPTGAHIVTASTGNHGLGVLAAGQLFGLPVTIFIPSSASQSKVNKLAELGAQLKVTQGDSLDAELAAKAYSIQTGSVWVSPYNDLDVIAGQGSIGVELSEQLKKTDKVYVTVGGGGLVSGLSAWLKFHQPETEIIGCQPVHSREMYLSVRAGRVVEDPNAGPTLSDGSAGPLEPDSITFPFCQEWIDRFMLIEETEIRHAIRTLYHHHHLVVEGAAGVAYAAALKDSFRKSSDHAVVILCGGNIDAMVHREICQP